MTLVATALLVALSMGGTKPAVVATGSRFEQGQRAFAAGDFKAALEALDAAVAEGPDSTTLEKAQLLRAQCFAAQQAFARAEDAFAAALDANPDAALDPSKVDPSLVKMLDSMRARLSGTLVVKSTPPGATVSVDGRAVGPAPLNLPIGIGHRTLEARWPGGLGVAVEVQVHPHRESLVVLAQAPAPEPKVVVREVPAPVAPEAPGLRGFLDARAMVDVLGVRIAPEGGAELGGGLERSWWRVGLYVRLFPQVHLVPRFAGVVPLVDRPGSAFNLAAVIELEVPVMLRSYGLGVGVGGAAGLEWRPTHNLAPYVQVGARGLFVNVGNNIDARFIVAGGVRVRLP